MKPKMKETGVFMETKVQVGMIISYQDMANPYHEGVIVEIQKVERNTQFILFGGSKPFEEITEQVTVIYPGSWSRSTIPSTSIKDNEYAGHQIVDKPILSKEEVNKIIAEYERMQPILQEQREQTEMEKNRLRETEKVRIRKENPQLISVDQSKLSSWALGAKNIKIELEQAFPGVKFSVKSESFSMGDSIDVYWTGNPAREDVDKIISKYQEGHFNSMDDLYEYSYNVWTDVFGGAKYVFANRRELNEN